MVAAILIVYLLALSVLFIFGLHGFSMVYHYTRLRPQDPDTVPLPADPPEVTVQLPLFNELYVAERLVDSVCRLEYPKERMQIQMLDDSTDETTELLERIVAAKRADGFRIHLLHRTDRSGYKAGALREGLKSATGEYVAIFDADFLPEPDFLLHALPHLVSDPGLGLVQGRWEHLNHDYSLLTRIQAIALDAHFAMEQQVRNRANYFMNFNGTAGVWRKSCIEDSGNWHADTLTEDLDLSYRAQMRGWRFLYLNDLTCPAELPSEINGLKSQQFRWTKGAIETAKKHLPSLWRSKQSLGVKLHGTAHLTSNIVFPCILLVAILNVPVLFLKKSRPDLAVLFDIMGIFILTSISTLLFYLFAQRDIREDWQRRMMIYPFFMAGTMGLAVNNTRAVFEALFNRKSAFERTPKYNILSAGDSWFGNRYRVSKVKTEVLLELLLALYVLIGMVMSIYFVELSLIPFQMMFLVGFGLTGFLSLRHAFRRRIA
ncbi:MAG: glycosyltransferase [Bacteroidetes bacterium]|nr:glycosyltransferase [Bacteroidota bacterium]